LPAVTPGLLTATAAPATKFVPVRVTGTLAPSAPLAGLTEFSVGGGSATAVPARKTPTKHPAGTRPAMLFKQPAHRLKTDKN
jgi:hypothetical protein